METTATLERRTYKPKEAAAVLGVSLPVMYDLCHRRDFPAIFIGNRILIPVDRFHLWISETADLDKPGWIATGGRRV